MTWALKRQIFYVLVLVAFISLSVFLIIYPSFTKAPTCSDRRQNGIETGVDCGGLCARACLAEVDDASVLWARAFKVIPGRYNAVAYIVNHNKNAAAQKVSYRFRFADVNNVYIGKREGTTFIPPGGNFAVFEPGIDIGNSIPVYVNFEFTEKPIWFQVSEDKLEQLKIAVSNILLTGEKDNPKLSATIKNNSLFSLPNVSVIAIIYDAAGNAISTSRTFLRELVPDKYTDINFTWPEPLPGEPVAKEIIPMFDVFSVNLR
jgi:hypothetical protein